MKPRILLSLLATLFVLTLLLQAAAAQVLGTEVGAVPTGPVLAIAGSAISDGAPAVAFDGTNFLAVTGNTTNIYATRISPSGTVLDNPPIVVSATTTDASTDPSLPSVVFDGTNYILVWVEGNNNEIYAARVSPQGAVLDSPAVQLTSGAQALERPIGLAFDGANLLVAWRTLSSNIYAARFTPALATLSAPAGFAVNSNGYYPWVAYGAGEYFISWHTGAGGRPGHPGCSTAQNCAGNLAIVGARVSTSGTVLDPTAIAISKNSNSVLQDHSSVVFDGANFIVAWHSFANSDTYNNGQALAARITPAGAVLDPGGVVVSPRMLWEVPPNLVFDGTNADIVWHADDSPQQFRLADVFLTRLSPSLQLLDAKPSPVATGYGNQFHPNAGYGSGKILVTWNADPNNPPFNRCAGCVYGQLMQLAASAGTPRTPPTPVTDTQSWVSMPSGVSTALQTVFALDDNNAWSTGQDTSGPPLLTYNGTAWSSMTTPGRNHLYAFWGDNPSSLWMTGWCWNYIQDNNAIMAGDLSATGCDALAPTALALWGAGTGDIFAVGVGAQASGPALYGHFDGNNWHTNGTISSPLDMDGVWGTSGDDVFAVGEHGTLLHFDGTQWSSFSSAPPTAERINGIWGDSDSNIYLVGDFGTILHFDGTAWTAMPSGVSDHLTSVWGFNSQDVYAVGFGGLILHYDGTSWASEPSPTTVNLTSVYGAGHTVWAVGDQGTILKHTVTGNPTPELLTATVAQATTSGGYDTLQITGENFVNGAVALWNGTALTTTVTSPTQLTAKLPFADLANPHTGNASFPNGYGEVMVQNPPPNGGLSQGTEVGNPSAPTATLSAASLTFSASAVGVTTAAQPVTLSNFGNVALSIANIKIAAPFTETNNCGSSLAAGATCTIQVTFTPTASGTASGSLTVYSDAIPDTQVVPLTGNTNAPALQFSANTLAFSSQALGSTSAPQTVTLTNSGSTTLAITAIAATVPFAETSTCIGNLAAGANCTVQVTFTPTATGSASGSLTVTDNAAGSPQSIALSGSGTAAPAAALSPASLTFPAQAVGTASSAQTVTLSNSGNAALAIASIAASSGFSETSTCGSSVAAGARCSIQVSFAPTAAGVASGTLSVNDNAPGAPQSIPLTGTGTGPAVTLSPASLTFAPQWVGTTSPAQTVTLANSGNAPLSLTGVTASSGFAEINNCGTTVAAGASCTIQVTFSPASGGAQSGTLTLADNAPGAPQSVQLSGTASALTPAPGSGSSTSSSISPGQTASYKLTYTPSGGASGTFALACTGAPASATCLVAPTSFTLSGSTPVSVTVTVTTTSSTSMLLLFGLLLLGLGVVVARKRARAPAFILGAALLLAACGGGSAPPPPPPPHSSPPATPAGTYTLTLTATSGATVIKTPLTLVVQ